MYSIAQQGSQVNVAVRTTNLVLLAVYCARTCTVRNGTARSTNAEIQTSVLARSSTVGAVLYYTCSVQYTSSTK